jgi:hypothetical protein
MSDPSGWDCSAYGPGAAEVGALCFLAGDRRVCADLGECKRVMTSERQRVFARISELAAAGDQVAIYIAAEFTHPDQLLNPASERWGDPG